MAATPPPATAPDLHRISTVVVGRDKELDQLDTILNDVQAGQRRSVFVSGGIGSGKSTLVAEFLERQDKLDSYLVARSRCIQTRGGVEPYFCLFDALGQLAVAEPDLVFDTLDRVAPSWLAQMPAFIDISVSERLERRLLGSSAPRMLREGADAFEALSRHHPLLLLLEDLQWADDLTLDVIDLLVHRVDPAPLLLLISARSDHAPLRTVSAPAVAAGRAIQIELGPLIARPSVPSSPIASSGPRCPMS
ncbi:MAG: ATP-binding protein [Actinomycetia bacterium]|nr:ATP-binding protein [Actinomycetes bacterium]